MSPEVQARLQAPRHVLLIKSHSMGVGDLLRSSAAWAALKARWPQVQLHLCMLSNHAGYVVQELISSHYLLASSHFVTVKKGAPGTAKKRPWPRDSIYGGGELARARRPARRAVRMRPTSQSIPRSGGWAWSPVCIWP